MIYLSHSRERLRLRAAALATLEFPGDGRIAIMTLTPDMFEQTGAAWSDTEDLINEPMTARQVVASILVVDQGDGQVRVSFRSKSPEVCGQDIDVAAIASGFGGGGHRRASGARVESPLAEVRAEVIRAVEAAMQSGGN